ncbi:transcription elongation factor GreB [Oligoflexia bacterium]|nr:transcription elongation factor GreB [Oligoflexia bacterium]
MEKNYITPRGFKKLQEELKHLKYTERPEVTEVVAWAAANGDRSENGDYIYGKKRLRQIDGRIRFLSKQLDAAEVVNPLEIDSKEVRFGATVTIRDEDGGEKTYAIVGMDEADAAQGRISWRSPLARAVLNRKVGDCIEFKSPKGEREIEIIGIQYLALEDL